MDTTKTLLTSVKHFFSGTALSRISGVFRDIAMAYAFGTQSTIAAFFVAFRLAHLFRRVLGEGAMQTAFIPKFEELRRDSPERACRFFRDLYGVITLVLFGIIILSILALGGFLSFGNLTEGNQEITALTLLMMPSLLFICLYGLNSSILQCEKIYFLPSVAPVLFNLTWILGTLLINYLQPEYPMVWLSQTIIVSCIAQWLITLPRTLKILKQYGLFKPWKGMSLTSKDLLFMGKPFFLGTIGIAAAQINSALDSVFARYADSEGPALLWYAIRIQQVPIGLFAIAFSGALLPPLSRAIKANDSAKFLHFLSYSVKKCLLIMIPVTIIIFLFGKFGIQLVYGRGHFDQQAILGTAHCLFAYTFGLIPTALVLVLAPAFYSRDNYKMTTIASVVSMTLNTGLNAILVMGFGLGAISVALATSASAWVNFMILAGSLWKSGFGFKNPELARKYLPAND